MAPRTNSDEIAEFRAKVEAARLAYERAPAGADRDLALWAWKVALDAFVAAVLPQEET